MPAGSPSPEIYRWSDRIERGDFEAGDAGLASPLLDHYDVGPGLQVAMRFALRVMSRA